MTIVTACAGSWTEGSQDENSCSQEGPVPSVWTRMEANRPIHPLRSSLHTPPAPGVVAELVRAGVSWGTAMAMERWKAQEVLELLRLDGHGEPGGSRIRELELRRRRGA